MSKDSDKIISIIKSQTAINKQILKIVSSLTMGPTSPDLEILRDLLRQNQTFLSELENKATSDKG